MSWSVNFIGKPENVSQALHDYSSKLGDKFIKEEYDAAVAPMIALVSQNWGNDNPIVKVSASGHGYRSGDEVSQRQCTVTIERVYGDLV